MSFVLLPSRMFWATVVEIGADKDKEVRLKVSSNKELLSNLFETPVLSIKLRECNFDNPEDFNSESSEKVFDASVSKMALALSGTFFEYMF